MCDYNDGLFGDCKNIISEKFRIVQLLAGRTEKLMDSKDKLARAPAEQVMDPGTRMILIKLLGSGIINVIHRPIISTGKKANVYHASSKYGKDYAIKIYKTSNDAYLSGEHEFGKGYSKSNPRKMARTRAEKETRTLARMFNANLNVPEPITLRSHVLVMSFIGDQGRPAPKLKDVTMSQSTACLLYKDCIMIMWKIFNICKLVHADLSEHTLLYHQGDIVVIDVAQSVKQDHPNAFEFLIKDCTNISSFFKKKEIPTLTVKELFDFITDSGINETNVEDWLKKMIEMASKRNLEELTCQEQFEEEVFQNTYIPKRLTEVINYEREATKGDGKDLGYKNIAGFKDDLFTHNELDTLGKRSTSESSESAEHEEEHSRFRFNTSARPRDETSDAKKARKRAAKEEKRRAKEDKDIIKRKDKRQGEK